MKVVGAGFGRTGTSSLRVALQTLGFNPCYHMHELFEHPEHAPMWLAAAAGEPVDWDQTLGGYQAIVDWPGAAFWSQILESYPDAQVLLSVRDPDAWYESVLTTSYPVSAAEAGSERATSDDPVIRVINTVVWQGTFGGRFRDKQHALSVFARHIEVVRDCVPEDQLLVYDVRQGWDPICSFLQVEVPRDMPFPRTNTREGWRESHT